MSRTWRNAVVCVGTLLLVGAACNFNPQPEPPAAKTGDGGSGTGTTSSTGTGTGSGTGTGTGSESSSGAGGGNATGLPAFGDCDTDEPASLDSQLCADCASCALGSEIAACATEAADCESNQPCVDFEACLDDCATNCGGDAGCYQACVGDDSTLGTCRGDNADGAALYDALYGCTICTACAANCDAATNCN